MPLSMRHFHSFLRIALALCALLVTGGSTAHAKTEQRCFPETGQCISGRFRAYWEQNGGLAVFGYPTTPAVQNNDPSINTKGLVQWFERARFEQHPENVPPYEV